MKTPEPMFKVLDREILVAAQITYAPNRWTAYIGIVPGKNHQNEWKRVLEMGTSLREDLARLLFPEFADLPYDR